MAEKIIRSHATRVKAAKAMLKENPRYCHERISTIDREAFVEYYLLEDIVRLYTIRLEFVKRDVSTSRADEKGKQVNIEKFTAIIDVMNAAIGSAKAALDSGQYSKVWKAIHEGPLMIAANSVKRLPELRALASEMLEELSRDMLDARKTAKKIDDDLDAIDIHERNVKRAQDLGPTMDEIEEVIRFAESVIPDKKNSGKINPNV